MPGGVNGRELAHQAAAVQPGLKILFAPGYPENILASEAASTLQFLPL